jgi:hypothetical protein
MPISNLKKKDYLQNFKILYINIRRKKYFKSLINILVRNLINQIRLYFLLLTKINYNYFYLLDSLIKGGGLNYLDKK